MHYYRNYGNSYMVAFSDSICRNHEVYMQQKNTIPSLLTMQVAVEGGQMQYWYEITGKISLDQYQKEHRPGQQFLRSFLLAYEKLEKTLQEYLMPIEHISLNPEEIFIQNGYEEFWFCHKPFLTGETERGMTGFLENFLQKMDHEKQQEASRCYQVYDLYISGCTRIQELTAILGCEPETAAIQSVPVEGPDHLTDKGTSTSSVICDRESSAIGNCIRSIKQAVRRKRKWEKESREQMVRQSVVVLPNEVQELPIVRPTVCLSDLENRVEGTFCYEGELEESSFSIREESVLVGNKQGDCQIRLSADTVSRLHARITKEQEQYYLEDLNSKNGTLHNGTVLNYRQKIMLEKNDQIQFADVVFRFI